MRIAVISDIHGNLPALESVIDDIKKRSVDRVICLGDLIGKGPSSAQVIEICRRECDAVVMGNWDSAVYKDYLAQKDGSGKPGKRSLWCIASVNKDAMEYLGSLPHCVELRLSGKLIRLFHAHPRNFNRYFADSPVEKRLELFGHSDSGTKELADAAVYADIHSAYMQVLEGRYLINVGSVGNPLDINRASYVILEGGADSVSPFGAEFIRVPYDIERAVELAIAGAVPDLEGYIGELRFAKYYPRT